MLFKNGQRVWLGMIAIFFLCTANAISKAPWKCKNTKTKLKMLLLPLAAQCLDCLKCLCHSIQQCFSCGMHVAEICEISYFGNVCMVFTKSWARLHETIFWKYSIKTPAYIQTQGDKLSYVPEMGTWPVSWALSAIPAGKLQEPKLQCWDFVSNVHRCG